MKNRILIQLILLGAFIAGSITGFAQFSGLSSELVTESEHGSTYRVYADFDSPGDYVSAVFATESFYNDPPLVISTTTSFFQSAYALGVYATGVNPAYYGIFTDLVYDSWLTIGAGPGVSSGAQDIGLDAEMASFAAGGEINTDGSYAGGSWFSIISPPFTAGSEGKVLLAQLTTDGIVTISLNLQWKNSIGEAEDVFGAELTLGAPLNPGCTNPLACNYNEAAEIDDDSCLIPGACDTCSGSATDGTGFIIDGDADDDGICNVNEVDGCTNPNACNYSTSATDDDGTCLVPNAENCETCTSGGLISVNDSDGDGVCDNLEIVGCTTAGACNYDATPTTDTDNSLCVYPSGCQTCSGQTDGSGTVLENDADGDGICDSDEIGGCLNSLACNYNANATDALNNCIYAGGSCETCSGETDGSGYIVPNDDDGDGVCNADEWPGCTDPLACNFNDLATEEDNTCSYPSGPCDACDGEGGIVVLDADNDGVCDENEVAGCQNSSACNFNTSATDDSGGCVFANSTCAVCSGETDGTGTVLLLDADGDGVCDDDEVSGCQNSLACNFNINATDDSGACSFPTNCETCSGETDGTGIILANDDDNDGICNAEEIAGCQDSAACNFNQFATDDSGGCVYPVGCESCSGETDGTGSVESNDEDGDGICNADEIIGCQDPEACNYNEDATDDMGDCIYAMGCDFCSGATDGTGSVLNGDADGDGICNDDEVAGCTYINACNFNPLATDDDGGCLIPDYALCQTCENNLITSADEDGDGICDTNEAMGCTDPAATNFDCTATEDDASCIYVEAEVYGCTYNWAPNFNPQATIDDGSCGLPACEDSDDDGICDQDEVHGCTDPLACNFSEEATENVGCFYPPSGLTCDGNCVSDADLDGVCDEDEVPGCSDPLASNFNADATDDNGSCSYPEPASLGCTYSNACNYDVSAEEDDGSCHYECYGCTDITAINFDTTATIDDGSCIIAEEEVYGCTYPDACNFSPLATIDNGNCHYTCYGCTDDEAENYSPSATLDDGSCFYSDSPVFGCTYVNACNYDENASEDDGSCDYGCYGCTDDTAENFDPEASQDDNSCIYVDSVVMGCTYPDACNFDETANFDDGSCDYNCYGCTEVGAANYDPDATIDNDSCVNCNINASACEGDLDNDDIVGTADLLIFLSVFGFPCN